MKALFCVMLLAIHLALPNSYVAAWQIPVSGSLSPGTDTVDRAMLAIMRETGYTSATLAISRNGKLVMSRGYGWQDQNRTKPINPSTRMRIASIDKCFAAVATYSLIRDAKLSLDARAYSYLQIKPFNDQILDDRVFQITVENLLDHKLGWDKTHDGFADETRKRVRAAFSTDLPTVEQYNAFMVAQSLQFPPGQNRVYSNYGYMFLRGVVAKAAGQRYLEYLGKLCQDVDVEIFPTVPADQRGYNEIFYQPETPPYFDCFTISAPDLCRFFERYWITGQPREGNGYVYRFFGSLPGTSSVIHQRADGINFAILFNERDKISNDEVDDRIDRAIRQVNSWPDFDLFEKFPRFPFRKWSDKTGKRNLEARLVTAGKERIWLEKRNGSSVDISISGISRKDRRWIDEQLENRRSPD